MRFRPEQHLRRQSEIRAVREQGRRIDCRAFMIWWRARASAAGATPPATTVVALPSRVCVIASGAAVGNAVKRARAKRRLREVFRHHQHRLPASCDLLMIARAAATDTPMPEMEQRFTEACARIVPPPSPSAS